MTRGGRVSALVPLGEAEPIDTLIRQYRDAIESSGAAYRNARGLKVKAKTPPAEALRLQSQGSGPVNELGQALAAKLWHPLVKHLSGETPF